MAYSTPDLFGHTDRHDPGGKVRHKVAADITSEAAFSTCERYRWSLSRLWDDRLPAILFLMMNPSTADIRVDDPTVAKCGRLARRWGYGRLYVGNVCGYRATDKLALLTVDDPVGPANLACIVAMAERSAMVVVAHGKLPKGLQHHAYAACDALEAAGHGLHYLRLADDGKTPWHPLYLPENVIPQPWSRSATRSG